MRLMIVQAFLSLVSGKTHLSINTQKLSQTADLQIDSSYLRNRSAEGDKHKQNFLPV